MFRFCVFLLCCGCVLTAVMPAFPAFALEKVPVRLRVSWENSTDTLNGEVRYEAGEFTDLQPLGVEAETSACAWIVKDGIRIQQKKAMHFNGFEVTVPYNPVANLRFRFSQNDDLASQKWVNVPLEKLLAGGEHVPLGEEDGKSLGQVSVTRVPGDTLRILLERDALVFQPGDVFRCYVIPNLLKTNDTQADLEVQVFHARETFEIQHCEKQVIDLRKAAPKHVEFTLPQEEGAYDIVLTLRSKVNKLMQPLSKPLTTGPLAGTKLDPTQVLAERRIQCVVLANEPFVATSPNHPDERAKHKTAPPAETEENSLDPLRKSLVVEIDPTKPDWWKALNQSQTSFLLPRWKRSSQESIGSKTSRTLSTDIGPMVELAQKSAENAISWEAYPLTVENTGTPHILEVEYPDGLEQSLGISIAEPNDAGAILPLGVDSGVEVPADVLSNETKTRPEQNARRWLKHRVIFWPKSKTPVILMTNRHASRAAYYGKIRILSLDEGLPPMFSKTQKLPDYSRRLVAPLFTKPVFAECFSASKVPGNAADFSIDDWSTFLDGAHRLTDYLNYMGCNGTMMAVYADGSTLYPSKVLAPSPKYDSGVFSASGQDTLRKDVLEMLFRIFDREQLTFIPAMDFSAPIPELEAAIRFPLDAPALKIQPNLPLRWLNANNQELVSTLATAQNGAPYYNILDDAVQEVVLRSLTELVQRYSKHPSFGGVSLLLHENSMLVLPPPQWGMDFATIEQFAKETNYAMPTDYAQRVRTLSSGEGAKAWQAWRTNRLTLFYRRAAALLNGVPNAKLYLAGTDYITRGNQPELGPNLQTSTTAEDVLARNGLDVSVLSRVPNIVFPRPERVQLNTPLVDAVTDLQWKQTPGTFRAFHSQATPSSLFYHPVSTLRLKDFDEKSPFQPTYAWFASTFTPSGNTNARRYAESLAMMDAMEIFDGGWTPAMGQEDSVRETIRILRQLPAVRFHAVQMSNPNDKRSQPVIFRSCPIQGENYAYAINMTPFPMDAQVYVHSTTNAPISTTAIRLSNQETQVLEQDTRGTFWRVRLAPYQIEAIRFQGAPIVLYDPVAFFSQNIQLTFTQQYQLLQRHLESLKVPALFLGLGNANFEDIAAQSSDSIPNWEHSPNGVVLDRSTAYSGSASLRLFSTGEPISIQSKPFTASPTGRLAVAVWMKGRTEQPPPVQFTLECKHSGKVFRRVANLQNSPQKIGTQWSPITININDLPVEEGMELSIGFELLGSGEVWLDNIQLSDMNFTAAEQQTLASIFTTFGTRIQRSDFVSCQSILESYWMRFLKENTVATPNLALNTRGGLPVLGTNGTADSASHASSGTPSSERSATGNIPASTVSLVPSHGASSADHEGQQATGTQVVPAMATEASASGNAGTVATTTPGAMGSGAPQNQQGTVPASVSPNTMPLVTASATPPTTPPLAATPAETKRTETEKAGTEKKAGLSLPKLPSLTGKKKEETDSQYIQEVPKEKSFKDRVKGYLPSW